MTELSMGSPAWEAFKLVSDSFVWNWLNSGILRLSYSITFQSEIIKSYCSVEQRKDMWVDISSPRKSRTNWLEKNGCKVWLSWFPEKNIPWCLTAVLSYNEESCFFPRLMIFFIYFILLSNTDVCVVIYVMYITITIIMHAKNYPENEN